MSVYHYCRKSPRRHACLSRPKPASLSVSLFLSTPSCLCFDTLETGVRAKRTRVGNLDSLCTVNIPGHENVHAPRCKLASPRALSVAPSGGQSLQIGFTRSSDARRASVARVYRRFAGAPEDLTDCLTGGVPRCPVFGLNTRLVSGKPDGIGTLTSLPPHLCAHFAQGLELSVQRLGTATVASRRDAPLGDAVSLTRSKE